jgi:hypothetical protein
MSIRNFWSLETGEVITVEELLKRIESIEVYFPLRDVGVDLLVVRGSRHVGIQVKESRYYVDREWKGTIGHSWHNLSRKSFLRESKAVDFYVFLTYLPRYGEHRMRTFENGFVIVPTDELEKRVERKPAGSRGIYTFCFNFEGAKVIEKRDEITDYSEYLDRWDLISKALLIENSHKG